MNFVVLFRVATWSMLIVPERRDKSNFSGDNEEINSTGEFTYKLACITESPTVTL